MPPIIALILCVSYVVFMLWLERRQSPDASRALWIPTIWMLLIASKPLGIWFPSPSIDPELGSPLDRAFLIIILCVALWILFQRRFNLYPALRENSWLIVLALYMLLSILWSDIPAISFKRWIRAFQAIVMALVILTENSPHKAIESILRRTTYVLIPFSLLLVKYFPQYGVGYTTWLGERMWIGVTLQKNGLGRLCLIAIFFLFWSILRRRQGHSTTVWKYEMHAELFVLFTALWLLKGPSIQAFSATALITLVVGLLVYLGLSLKKKSGSVSKAAPLMTLVAAFIIVGIVAVLSGGSDVGFLASYVGRDATLTGRTDIWATLLPVAMQSPLVGKGYGGFWTYKIKNMLRISEGHSGYLDIFLDLGIFGILLLSAFLLSSCQKAQRELSNDFDWGVLWICFIIMAVVHNISESSINTFSSQLSAIILFFSVSSTKVGKRE